MENEIKEINQYEEAKKFVRNLYFPNVIEKLEKEWNEEFITNNKIEGKLSSIEELKKECYINNKYLEEYRKFKQDTEKEKK